jgi:hypothetical protein
MIIGDDDSRKIGQSNLPSMALKSVKSSLTSRVSPNIVLTN